MLTVLILMLVMFLAATSIAVLCLRRSGPNAANPVQEARFVGICCFLCGLLASVLVLWATGNVLLAGLTGVAVIVLGAFASWLPRAHDLERDVAAPRPEDGS